MNNNDDLRQLCRNWALVLQRAENESCVCAIEAYARMHDEKGDEHGKMVLLAAADMLRMRSYDLQDSSGTD